MPLYGYVRYRVKKMPNGKRVRLAFQGGRVVETKVLPKRKMTKSKKRLTKRRRRLGL